MENVSKLDKCQENNKLRFSNRRNLHVLQLPHPAIHPTTIPPPHNSPTPQLPHTATLPLRFVHSETPPHRNTPTTQNPHNATPPYQDSPMPQLSHATTLPCCNFPAQQFLHTKSPTQLFTYAARHPNCNPPTLQSAQTINLPNRTFPHAALPLFKTTVHDNSQSQQIPHTATCTHHNSHTMQLPCIATSRHETFEIFRCGYHISLGGYARLLDHQSVRRLVGLLVCW